MAVYAYIAAEAANPAAAVCRGAIAADSPRQARDQLRARGLEVRQLAEQRPATPGPLARYLARRRRGEVTGLLQEMATLLAAGIPLLEALDTIIRQHAGGFQRSIMLLRDHVAAGGSLAEAMALQPALYDELCVNIVEVGENAGTLELALERLIGFRRRSSGMRNRVASALLYPCIVLAVGLGVSLFLMTFVTPRLLGVLTAAGKPLPAATRAVKAVSDFLIAGRWLLPIGAAAAVAGIAAVLRHPRGRRAFDALVLRLPLVGDLVRKQAIARMAMVMAVLLGSDVVFVRAVRIASRTARNLVLREALLACETAVGAGRDIAAALEATAAFPPLVVQIFAVGQASGRLETMLENLAADYDTQVDLAAGRLTTLLEPLMMVLLAVVVGFIAFATILPILEAGDVL